ncbi:MAG: nitroreductase family protein [Deltaproteobacteria bacterium]|nr:nitroreductase family protein [Deltaproteobacteria bacterium]
MSEDIGLFEAMATMRAMRRLKPDPVPEPLLWRLIEAATKAASGGNRQPWHFVIVRDVGAKRFIQQRYHAALQRYAEAGMKAMAAGTLVMSEEETARRMRTARTGLELGERLAEVPVLLFACIDRSSGFSVGSEVAECSGLYGSIYPAVQNILLACRALGLGAVLTTLHLLYEDEIKAHLGIPPQIHAAAMIPIGFPRGRFGPVTRRPVAELTHWDRWGSSRQPATTES